MAFGKVAQSTEAVEIKRYVGVAPVKVLAVNPDKATLEKYFNTTLENEPTYTGDNDGIKYARIDFIIATDAEKCGIDLKSRITFFIRNQYNKGSRSGKYQVIDEYGREAWATDSVIQAKGKIMYKDDTVEANITQNYRPAYVGELELTDFLRKFVNIPEVMEYVNGTWVMRSDADKCECRFDDEDIIKLFKNDFTPIKEAIALQPNNKVKALFGIRTDKDGREFQDVYTTVLKNNSSNYKAIEEEIKDRKNNGGLANRTYEFCELKEYVVVPTSFEDPLENVKSPW